MIGLIGAILPSVMEVAGRFLPEDKEKRAAAALHGLGRCSFFWLGVSVPANDFVCPGADRLFGAVAVA